MQLEPIDASWARGLWASTEGGAPHRGGRGSEEGHASHRSAAAWAEDPKLGPGWESTGEHVIKHIKESRVCHGDSISCIMEYCHQWGFCIFL